MDLGMNETLVIWEQHTSIPAQLANQLNESHGGHSIPLTVHSQLNCNLRSLFWMGMGGAEAQSPRAQVGCLECISLFRGTNATAELGQDYRIKPSFLLPLHPIKLESRELAQIWIWYVERIYKVSATFCTTH